MSRRLTIFRSLSGASSKEHSDQEHPDSPSIRKLSVSEGMVQAIKSIRTNNVTALREAIKTISGGTLAEQSLDDGSTLLHFACERLARECILQLLHCKDFVSCINAQDSNGWTPLLSFTKNYVRALQIYETPFDPPVAFQVCKQMLEMGSDPSLRSKISGDSFIHVAVQLPNCKDLEELIVLARKKGADLCVKNNNGFGILHYICQSPHENAALLLRFVLELIPVEECLAVTTEGFTCAHFAAAVGNKTIIQVLKERYPKVLTISTRIGSPYVVAYGSEKQQIVKLLEDERFVKHEMYHPLIVTQDSLNIIPSPRYGLSQISALQEKIELVGKRLMLDTMNTMASEGETLNRVAQLLIRERVMQAVDGEQISKLEEAVIPSLQERFLQLVTSTRSIQEVEESLWKHTVDLRVRLRFSRTEDQQPLALLPHLRSELVQFVCTLRANTPLLASILTSTSPCTKLPDATRIVFSLFNPFEPNAQRKQLLAICDILKEHIKDRANDKVNKRKMEDLLSLYFKAIDGNEYLWVTLTPFLTEIVENPNLLLRASTNNQDDYSIHLQTTLLQSIQNFPYEFRYLASQISELFEDKQTSIQEMRDYIISNLIAPAIFNPERYGVVTSSSISTTARNNLKELTQRVISDMNFLSQYFQEFCQIEDPDVHYILEQDEGGQFDLVFKIKPLLRLFELTNAHGEIKISDELFNTLKRANEKRLVYVSLPKTPRIPKVGEDPRRKTAKSKLRLLLQLLGGFFNVHRKVVPVLLSITQTNTHFEKHVLMTLLYDALESLSKLPQEDKCEDFRSLLEEMYQEGKERMQMERCKLQQLLLACERYKQIIRRLEKRLTSHHQSLAGVIVKKLYSLENGSNSPLYNLNSFFCNRFKSTYQQPHRCEWNLFEHLERVEVCSYCKQQRQETFRFFLVQENLLDAQEWDKTTQVRHAVVTLLQRNTLEELSDCFLHEHHLDVELNDLLSQIELPLETFETDTTLSVTLAKEELRAINAYKSPSEKHMCLMKCTGGIISALNGDSDPNKTLPLLTYVLYMVKPARIITNLRFILLFTESCTVGYSFINAVSLLRWLLKEQKNKVL